MAFPGLPQSGRTRIYRKAVAYLKTNPVLESLGVEWKTWDGGPQGILKPTESARRLTIEVFPTLGPMQDSSADAQSGDMEIVVRMFVPGTTDVCDCMDLWAQVEETFKPFNDLERQRAIRKNLLGCGDGGPCDAVTGEIKFIRPATVQPDFDDKGAIAFFYCVGSMSIAVRRVINP